MEFAPFKNFHDHAAHKIISRLEYLDVVDLAHSCRYWYNTVVNAPQHVKPELKLFDIQIENNVITGHTRAKGGGPIGIKVSIAMDKIWNMIGKLHCENYTIITKNNDLESTADEIDGYLNFLLKNRHRLLGNLHKLRFQYPSFRKIEFDVLNQLFDMFTFFDFQHDHNRKVPDDWKEDMKTLLRKSLHLDRFFCGFRMDIDFCIEIWKQVLEGKRPKLWIFECPLEKCKEPVKRLLKDIDPSRISRDGQEYVVERPNMFPPINLVVENGMFEIRRETLHYYNAGVPFAFR